MLEHRALAGALASVIRDTPKDEPLGIALFGGWGQGKTTIGNLLADELDPEIRSRRYLFVKVDAWKYAHEGTRDPLRRHYLLAAYEAAGLKERARGLRREFRETRQVRRVRSSSERKRLLSELSGAARKFELPVPTLPRVIAVTAVFAIVFFLVPVDAAAGAARWFAAAIAALALLLWPSFLRALQEALLVAAKTDPVRSIEEFEDQFAIFLDEDARDTAGRPVERVIFLIDDLDRCDDSVVVEAIETLQAFFGRDRCVYIVAADHDQLRRAVRLRSQGPASVFQRARIPADETFLEKVFQVATFVPPLYHDTLRAYARGIADETLLSQFDDAEQDDLLDYLVHPLVRSPRQVRVIINHFIITYLEALRREADPRAFLQHKPLTRSKLLLAKLVVIRAHFPWFYALLEEDPRLLLVWQQYVDGDVDETTAEVAEARTVIVGAAQSVAREQVTFAKLDADAEEQLRSDSVDEYVSALRGFLVRTRRTRPEDAQHVQEFMHLRSSREFAELVGTSGEKYRIAIANGDRIALRELVDEDPGQAVPAARLAIAKMRTGRKVERDAAEQALLALIAAMPDALLQEVGASAAEVMYGATNGSRS
jgi:hypothetical protein